MMRYLDRYSFPEDIKKLSSDELGLLSYDIRDFLLENIPKTGGHLASNLGVVELSIALVRSFDFPTDKIIWDVGHQSYVYKILTGRKDGFSSLRMLNGLSGFPKRDESCFDFMDSGHASNSLSVAYGMAKARDLKGGSEHIVCVTGDGAFTGGELYEGLNNAGASKSKLILILNDNEMSITRSRGAFANHLGKLRLSDTYLGLKKEVKERLSGLPGDSGRALTRAIGSVKDSVKYLLLDGATLFEELGFTYIGPIDGHNISSLLEALETAKRAEGPVLIHCLTVKGKGFKDAEEHPEEYHGISKRSPYAAQEKSQEGKSYSEIFGEKLTELSVKDESICAITAAMTDGTGLKLFQKTLPERFYDVGIAEEHAVSFAAGLALSGMRPVVAIYSTFLQRAYDQMLMDVCMQNLPVVFAIDRAGIVGEDGPTHHGNFDLSYLSSMPNLTVLAPKDGSELEAMLEFALSRKGPVAIRYPKGKSIKNAGSVKAAEIGLGSETIIQGRDAELWALGSMFEKAEKAVEILKERRPELSIGLINPRFVKPIDSEALIASAKRTKNIISIEDNVIAGGFGSDLRSFLAYVGADGEGFARLSSIGWPNKFIEQGSQAELFERYRLDAAGLAERIEKIII